MTDNLDLKLELPLWNIQGIYKNYEDPEYINDKNLFSETVQKIQETASTPSAGAEWFKNLIMLIDKAEKIFENLNSYCYALYSTDTENASNLKEINSLEKIQLILLKSRFTILNNLSETDIEAAVNNKELSDFTLFFKEMLTMKKHLLSEKEEEIIELLFQPGANSWSRLQEAVSSTTSVKWDEKTGSRKTVTELRNLAFHPDRKTRQKAFDREIKGWKQMEIPLAYALNGVKGFNLIINSRKTWGSDLEKSLFQARMKKESLETMISAMEKSLPLFQKYFTLKAKALGLEKLAFYDLFAPLNNGDPQIWKFSDGKKYIVDTFSSFSTDFGEFAEKAFNNSWIDAKPRSGKIGGAYCTSFPLNRESRVLANYNGSFSSVSTIAHELGHAYHFELLKDSTQIHQNYPMTLAETASIFSEILLYSRAVEDENIKDRTSVLEMFLQEISQVIVDILSRFYFEKAVFEKRKEGELTPQEYCSLMEDAQKKTYGKSLSEDTYHRYMWAVKGHYYIPSLSFYNYPYAFGQLFGIALYNSYRRDKENFPTLYKEILKETGRNNVEETAEKGGFRLDDENFWLDSFSFIENLVEKFSEAVK